MAKQTVLTKKRRGPPPTGKGHTIGVRVQPDLMGALDAWIAAQPDPKPSRPEAIRRLLDARLRGEQAKGKRAKVSGRRGKGTGGSPWSA